MEKLDALEAIVPVNPPVVETRRIDVNISNPRLVDNRDPCRPDVVETNDDIDATVGLNRLDTFIVDAPRLLINPVWETASLCEETSVKRDILCSTQKMLYISISHLLYIAEEQPSSFAYLALKLQHHSLCLKEHKM